MMSLIRFENVGLRYSTGPEVLSDVNVSIAAGSFHFLTGASGSGKTSLLKLLYAGQKPTRGGVHIMDQNIASLSPKGLTDIRRKIGIVFQDFRLLNHLSAFDNVALPLRAAGIDKQKINKSVNELLNWVGLADRINARPQTLSGGEQQRIAIARAIINRPKILLADEPTGNVDNEIGIKLLNLFDQLNQLGTTVLIATHDQSLMARYKHPILTLANGSLTKSEGPHG